MSHTSTINAVKITSVSAMRAAVEELKKSGVRCELLENATPRAYYPGQAGLGQADFVLKLNDASYDVGLYKVADGSYEARTDFYGRTVEQCLGGHATTPDRREQARLGRFFQAYSIAAATEHALRSGASVRRIEDPTNHKVTLELTMP